VDVAIAHPRVRDRSVLELTIRSGSVSTSGGSERDLRVDGQRVAHILDPRTGRPATFDGSVTVWHASGLAADILSTALYVMGPDEGLAWAEARGLSACFLINDSGGEGTSRMTAAFRPLLARHAENMLPSRLDNGISSVPTPVLR
jgi:thiamine biosynthesis lipoprotein